MPGPRAWFKVIAGLERVVGEAEPDCVRLRAAIDEFQITVRNAAGNFTNTQLEVRRYLESHCDKDLIQGKAGVHERGFEVFSEIMGYSVEYQLHADFMRPAPGREGSMEHMTVQSIMGLQATRNAMSFSLHYHMESGEGSQDDLSHSNDSRVLAIGTSTPTPEIMLADKGRTSLAVLQNDWASSEEPTDISILHKYGDAVPLPWNQGEGTCGIHKSNAHPTRTFVLDRYMSKSFTGFRSVECASVRMRPGDWSHTAYMPWFDRIGHPMSIERYDHLDDVPDTPRCDVYRDLIGHVIESNGWDADDLVVYRTEIAYPITLAAYVTAFYY